MSAVDTLARTLFGEARGEAIEGKAAVANVILTRAKKGGWWGGNIEDVCLHPWQFSCWNKSDPNIHKIKRATIADPLFHECLIVAHLAVAGLLKDNTDGATHYVAAGVNPKWMRGLTPCVTIGAHQFFNDVE